MDYPLWNAKDLEMRSKGNYNDWSIIIARCEFRDELRENRFELPKSLYDSSRSICPAMGINTSAPKMTTTSITKRSTSTASNAVLWDSTAIMEHR